MFMLFSVIREGGINTLRGDVPFLGRVRINFRNFRGGLPKFDLI